jgi:hypothetical protein
MPRHGATMEVPLGVETSPLKRQPGVEIRKRHPGAEALASLARDPMAPASLARDPMAPASLARDPMAPASLARDPQEETHGVELAQASLARDPQEETHGVELAQASLARDPLASLARDLLASQGRAPEATLGAEMLLGATPGLVTPKSARPNQNSHSREAQTNHQQTTQGES